MLPAVPGKGEREGVLPSVRSSIAYYSARRSAWKNDNWIMKNASQRERYIAAANVSEDRERLCNFGQRSSSCKRVLLVLR